MAVNGSNGHSDIFGHTPCKGGLHENPLRCGPKNAEVRYSRRRPRLAPVTDHIPKIALPAALTVYPQNGETIG